MSSDDANPDQIAQYTKKSIGYGLLSIIIILVIIAGLYQGTSARDYIAFTLVNIDFSLLIVGWLCMVAAIAVLGYRWKALLPQHTEVTGLFLAMCLAGALLLNYAVPGPFGELAAAWFLHRRSSVSLPLGLATMLVGRLIGLACAALGTLIFWFALDPAATESVEWLLRGLVIGISAGFIILVLLFTVPKRIRPFAKNWGPFGNVITQFVDAISETTSLHQHSYYWATFWSVIGHALAALGVWLSLLSIGEPTSVIGVVFSYLSSTCCGVVAFLFPGSQLAWDAIFASLLVSSAEYNLAEATSAVVLLRVEQLALMLCGAIPLLWLIHSERTQAR